MLSYNNLEFFLDKYFNRIIKNMITICDFKKLPVIIIFALAKIDYLKIRVLLELKSCKKSFIF